jgi:hypothetical protein
MRVFAPTWEHIDPTQVARRQTLRASVSNQVKLGATAVIASRTKRSTKLSHSPTMKRNGYYARIKAKRKEIRRSLKTTENALAKRRLADLKRNLAKLDLNAGHVTVGRITPAFPTSPA